MINPLRVFVDSDVIISSLISQKGAAFLLLSKKGLSFYISNLSKRELAIVVERLNIDRIELSSIIKNKLKILTIKETLGSIKTKFSQYTKDPNDAHIVAGASRANAKFLITYNLRDYKIDKIKHDFGIICLNPGQFLQYLRSLRKIYEI